MDDHAWICGGIKLKIFNNKLKTEHMSTRLEILKKDIIRLKKSKDWLESKLEEIDNGSSKDPSQATKYIKDKTETELLLREKEKELQTEKENSRVTDFGGIKMRPVEIARLSVGGSLKTSSLDKTALTDEKKKEIVDGINKESISDAEKASKLFDRGIILQRKMLINKK
jgi:hypothetical protein